MPTRKSIEYIQDLKHPHLHTLTNLLTLPANTPTPTHSWLTRQTQHLTSPSFPAELKKPSSLVPKLVMAALDNIFGPKQAHLCKSHKLLNPYLIHRIWVRISLEVTTHISQLLISLQDQDQNHSQKQKQNQKILDFTKRLSSINSLWLSSEFYRTIYQAQPSDARYEEIPGGCEACILAAVGGNPQILTDLRASVLGRRRKRRRKNKKRSRHGRGREGRGKEGDSLLLLPILEAWIDGMSESESESEFESESEKLRGESERLGREIRYFRREMQLLRRERREKRRNTTEDGRNTRSTKGTGSTRDTEDESVRVKSVDPRNLERPQNPVPVGFGFLDEEEEKEEEEEEEKEEEENYDKDEGEEHDFEGSIIDFYANLMSTASLIPSVHGTTEGMPPAFRNSVVFDPVTGTFHRAAPEQHARNDVSSVYSQSVYSDAGTGIGMKLSSKQSLDPQNRSAEKYAQAYRNLVGIEEEEEDRQSVGNRTSQRRRVKRGTMI